MSDEKPTYRTLNMGTNYDCWVCKDKDPLFNLAGSSSAMTHNKETGHPIYKSFYITRIFGTEEQFEDSFDEE